MKKSLKNRIKTNIRKSKNPVFMIDDFKWFSSDKDQVQRALRQLMTENVVVRVGKGVYVRAKVSSLTNEIIPELTLREIAEAVVEKSGGKVMQTSEQRAYNERRTTQLPNMNYIGTNKRMSRKIKYKNREINYVTVKQSLAE